MASGTFGRKVTDDGEMERRRAAFIASERVRAAARPDQPAVEAMHRPPSPAAPSFGREKSMALAYLLWFVCGQLSAHRFYLGYPLSGTIQASLWIGGWISVLSGVFQGLMLVGAAVLWALADLFIIPSLHRGASERGRRSAAAHVFA